jgi:hypothetical protein
MISLCKDFAPRVEVDKDYPTWLVEQYKKVPYTKTFPKYVNAHVGKDIHHIDRLYEYIPKEQVLNNDRKLLIQGHIFNFYHAYDTEILKELGKDYVGIILDYPEEGTLPYHRITTYEYHSPMRDYHFPTEIGSIHNDSYIKIDDSNGFMFKTVNLFTKDGSENLRVLLADKFGIELPKAADQLHEMWWKWMTHILDPKTIALWGQPPLGFPNIKTR